MRKLNWQKLPDLKVKGTVWEVARAGSTSLHCCRTAAAAECPRRLLVTLLLLLSALAVFLSQAEAVDDDEARHLNTSELESLFGTKAAPKAGAADDADGAAAGGKRGSRVSQIALNIHRERVRPPKHTTRGPFYLLERRNGLAEIVERRAVDLAEHPPVIRPQPEREFSILSANASCHGNRSAQQCLRFFVAPQRI